jgi:hypothetical protein
MQLFEVTWSGIFPVDQNGQPLRNVEILLHAIDSVYRDATLALHFFRSALATYVDHMRSADSRAAIGDIPVKYFAQLPAMYGREFVYSLDTFLKCVRALSNIPNVPASIVAVIDDFQRDFPNLLSVRDSAHHLEDRVQGMVRNRPLNLQPVSNSAFNAPNGALIIGVIRGENYGITAADGSYVEVAVTESSMNKLKVLYERLLNIFDWR